MQATSTVFWCLPFARRRSHGRARRRVALASDGCSDAAVEDRADVAVSLPADALVNLQVAALLAARVQPSVGDQLLRRGEPVDVPDLAVEDRCASLAGPADTLEEMRSAAIFDALPQPVFEPVDALSRRKRSSAIRDSASPVSSSCWLATLDRAASMRRLAFASVTYGISATCCGAAYRSLEGVGYSRISLSTHWLMWPLMYCTSSG